MGIKGLAISNKSGGIIKLSSLWSYPFETH